MAEITLESKNGQKHFKAAQALLKVGKILPNVSIRSLQKLLRCDCRVARLIRQKLFGDKPSGRVAGMPPDSAKEVNEVTADGWKISLTKTRIHTLEELIKYFEIDLDEWEVERFIANKWEVSGKFGDRGREHFEVEPLYQVKAFMRRKRFSDMGKALDENAKLTRQLAKARVDLGYERKISKRLGQNHAGFDDLLSRIGEVTTILGDFKMPLVPLHSMPSQVEPATSPGHSEDAVLLLSDFHFSDKIRPEDVSGFPEYDLVIGGNRLGYVIGTAKQVLALHRAMYPIKKLYVWFGGDIGNGILHDSPESNELFIPAQVHFSYLMCKSAVEDLLTLTQPDLMGNRIIEEIVLLFSVGNHMRMDEKMPLKLQALRTFDWLIYELLIDKFKDYPLISLHNEVSPFIFEVIRGHRYLFTHGTQVGFRNNPSAQSKNIGSFIQSARALFDSPEWRAKNLPVGAAFDRVCCGDIHIPITFPRFKSNGALNGQNELGVGWLLEPIPAGQQIFGVSNRHLETWGYFIEATHVQRRPEDMNSYGIVAKEYQKKFGR